MKIIENINIDPLIKAFDKFEQFRKNDLTEQEKAGTIQAFEYTFELTWKTMKRLLNERGVIANSPKEVFRVSALEGFIQNTELWFVFLLKRNLTVHAYNESYAREIIDICDDFSKEVYSFLKNIGAFND